MTEGLVSVIMPAFNAESFIKEAIDSVLSQTYKYWELIIINDGSTDQTKKIILGYSDSRIVYLEQENRGVSGARNLGLRRMGGEYLCFLDSDDIMPRDSISSRLEIFSNHEDASIVGGAQYVFEGNPTNIVRIQEPTFEGIPTEAIAMLDPGCFINCGTWLIKLKEKPVFFPENWTHLEDACFFLRISHWGMHYASSSPAQYYRKRSDSAMADTLGLVKCYLLFYHEAIRYLSFEKTVLLKMKIIRIMVVSLLNKGHIGLGLKWGIKYLFA